VARGTGRGPGWQRAQSAGQFSTEPVRIVEARASAVSLGNKGRDDMAVGLRVFHQKFGYGTVAQIEGNKLEIDFETAGRKRVMDSFVSVG
jgi:DNA helicase-2/ATP-dependent DNA helicase PcrA